MAIINISKDNRHTKNGVIPENWELIKLSTYNKSLISGVSVNSEDQPKKNGEYGILKTSSISNGSFLPEENKAIADPKELQRAKLNPTKNRLLISRMNTPDLVGACAYINESRDDLFIPDRLWLAEFESSSIEAKWLNYLLNSDHYKAQIKNRASGTSNSMKNISKPSFLGLFIPLPPLPEQQKISEILSTWDLAISTTQNQIEEIKLRNKGLAQQLLTGKKRLKGFEAEWEEVRADKIFKNHTNKSHNGDLEILSATQERGVIPRSMNNIDIKFDKDSLGTYKKVEIGDFVISLRSFQGGIEYSEYTGLVSPAYTVLKEVIPIVKTFFKIYFKTGSFISRLNTIIYGIRDGKQISYKDFSTLKLQYPPFEEQKAISQVLSEAEKELKLYVGQIDALKEQKKGLMQKLLTGEIRVKTD
jgi:type I restriction enzyme S subunit